MLKIDTEALQSVDTAEPDREASLTDLLEEWTTARSQELTANQRRVAIEQQLAVLLSAPEEGQKSYRIGSWRVVRTNKFNYRADLRKLRTLAEELELPDLTKEVLDEAAVKRLRKLDKLDFDLLVAEGAVTVAVGKPHFEVALVPCVEVETT